MHAAGALLIVARAMPADLDDFHKSNHEKCGVLRDLMALTAPDYRLSPHLLHHLEASKDTPVNATLRSALSSCLSLPLAEALAAPLPRSVLLDVVVGFEVARGALPTVLSALMAGDRSEWLRGFGGEYLQALWAAAQAVESARTQPQWRGWDTWPEVLQKLDRIVHNAAAAGYVCEGRTDGIVRPEYTVSGAESEEPAQDVEMDGSDAQAEIVDQRGRLSTGHSVDEAQQRQTGVFEWELALEMSSGVDGKAMADGDNDTVGDCSGLQDGIATANEGMHQKRSRSSDGGQYIAADDVRHSKRLCKEDEATGGPDGGRDIAADDLQHSKRLCKEDKGGDGAVRMQIQSRFVGQERGLDEPLFKDNLCCFVQRHTSGELNGSFRDAALPAGEADNPLQHRALANSKALPATQEPLLLHSEDPGGQSTAVDALRGLLMHAPVSILTRNLEGAATAALLETGDEFLPGSSRASLEARIADMGVPEAVRMDTVRPSEAEEKRAEVSRLKQPDNTVAQQESSSLPMPELGDKPGAREASSWTSHLGRLEEVCLQAVSNAARGDCSSAAAPAPLDNVLEACARAQCAATLAFALVPYAEREHAYHESQCLHSCGDRTAFPGLGLGTEVETNGCVSERKEDVEKGDGGGSTHKKNGAVFTVRDSARRLVKACAADSLESHHSNEGRLCAALAGVAAASLELPTAGQRMSAAIEVAASAASLLTGILNSAAREEGHRSECLSLGHVLQLLADRDARRDTEMEGGGSGEHEQAAQRDGGSTCVWKSDAAVTGAGSFSAVGGGEDAVRRDDVAPGGLEGALLLSEAVLELLEGCSSATSTHAGMAHDRRMWATTESSDSKSEGSRIAVVAPLPPQVNAATAGQLFWVTVDAAVAATLGVAVLSSGGFGDLASRWRTLVATVLAGGLTSIHRAVTLLVHACRHGTFRSIEAPSTDAGHAVWWPRAADLEELLRQCSQQSLTTSRVALGDVQSAWVAVECTAARLLGRLYAVTPVAALKCAETLGPQVCLPC
jgi:hypothetical protein